MTQNQKGFIPVMLTPFHDDGRIDFDGLSALTDLYLESGAAGLFANCQSSEMYELTDEERLQTIAHICKQVNGAVPVVATGTFDTGIGEQAEFIKKVYQQGCEAVIFITGILAKPEDPESVLADNTYELFRRTPGIPTGFYECPEPYKRLLSPPLLKELIGTGRVVYHKDTSLDIEQVRQKITAGQGTRFGLYDAYMAHAVASLKAGSAGLSCIQGNYYPELVVWLCDHFDDADKGAQVEKVQQFFIDHMDVMHDCYPVTAKIFLQQRGLPISQYSRRKVGVPDQQLLNRIGGLHKAYIELLEHLSLKAVLV